MGKLCKPQGAPQGCINLSQKYFKEQERCHIYESDGSIDDLV